VATRAVIKRPGGHGEPPLQLISSTFRVNTASVLQLNLKVILVWRS
jgi:hypothetical protein